MAGRKRLLNDTKQREICALLSAGCGLVDAAKYVCCTPITIRREAQRNPQFAEQLRQAQLSAQLTPLQALRKAASSHWRAAAWLLERIEPDRFVKRNPKLFTDKQIRAMVGQLTEAVRAEVHDPEAIVRIAHRFGEFERQAVFNAWAANSTYAQIEHAFPKRKTKRHAVPETTSTPAIPATHALDAP